MVRALSKSLIVPRLSPSASSASGERCGLAAAVQSVQRAGMSDRLPSGSTAIRYSMPRRFRRPMTVRRQPSNACRSRVIVMNVGRSSEWVVCGCFLRFAGPFGPALDPEREDPRRPFPTADRQPAPGWLSGGLAIQRYAERQPARVGAQSYPLEYLLGQAGSLCRNDAPSEVQPWRSTQTKPAIGTYARSSETAGEIGVARRGQSASTSDEAGALS
jgi:hypothetical protein